MVCVNQDDPRGIRLVRSRPEPMAVGLHAKWIAVYVETPRHLRLSECRRIPSLQILRLAERIRRLKPSR